MAETATQDRGALGLIAGDGRLPLELARAVGRKGRAVHAVAFCGLTEPALAQDVDVLRWLHLGELEALIGDLQAAGVRDVVMAGKVSKTFLFERRHELRLDARAEALLAGLPDHADDSILALLASELEKEGLRLLPQAELAPSLAVAQGPLGRLAPSADQWSDMCSGWSVAKALGAVDVGQTVVVERGAVLAVEAIEGTDAAIRRGGSLGSGSACVVKVAKPNQDPRFDLPVIGLGTLECMLSAGVAALACEAGRTLVVEREALLREADAAGVALVGIAPEGPQSLVAARGAAGGDG